MLPVPPTEIVDKFIARRSEVDVLWEMAGCPKCAILLGSGTDLDSLLDWPILVAKTPGTVISFNLKTFKKLSPDKPHLIITNRGHTEKKNKFKDYKVVHLTDLEDDVARKNNIIYKHSCPQIKAMTEWISFLNKGKVWKLSTGFCGAAVFIKRCSQVFIGGFDGYKGISRKNHKWHSGISGTSGKHHDYNLEFSILMALVRTRKIKISASTQAANFLTENDVTAGEWLP